MGLRLKVRHRVTLIACHAFKRDLIFCDDNFFGGKLQRTGRRLLGEPEPVHDDFDVGMNAVVDWATAGGGFK
jgi:hypothetical protein